MKIHKLLVIFVVVQIGCSARHSFRTNFIQSFIINEHKPTFVVFADLCWTDTEKINLANEILKVGSRVSSMKINYKYQQHLLYLVDIDCPKFDQLLALSSSNLFSPPNRWLILSNSTNKNGKLESLWNALLLSDTDVVLAEETGDKYLMNELHRLSLNHTMMATPRGFYNGSFIDIRLRREMYRRRMNLKGRTLTMVNVIQDSNSTKDHMEDELELQYDLITKISWMVGKQAILMLNATPKSIYSYRWGYKVNGQWSGMVSDLQTGKADIGSNCLMATSRMEVVSFTDPMTSISVSFVFRQPPLSYVSNIYSLPFNSNLWVGVAVCAVVSVLAILGAAKWEIRFGRTSSQLSGSVSDAMFWTMGALSQQGSDMEPRRTPGRIMECVVFTSLMALYAAYSANIVVLLQAPSSSIRSLPQLASSKITLAALDVDYNHFVFKQHKDPVQVTIRNKIEPEKGKQHFYDINEGIERVRQGLFALHALTEPLYRRIEQTFHENEKCDLTEIDCLNSFQPYAPVGKESPYKELIRVALKRIRETGITSALNRRYQVPKPRCLHKTAAFASVGVRDLKPVLLLMVIGCGASLVVLLLEIAVFSLKQKMENNKIQMLK